MLWTPKIIVFGNVFTFEVDTIVSTNWKIMALLFIK